MIVVRYEAHAIWLEVCTGISRFAESYNSHITIHYVSSVFERHIFFIFYFYWILTRTNYEHFYTNQVVWHKSTEYASISQFSLRIFYNRMIFDMLLISCECNIPVLRLVLFSHPAGTISSVESAIFSTLFKLFVSKLQ